MPQIIPSDFRDGDALEPWHLNFIFRFVRRWMRFDASPPLSLDNGGEAPPHLSFLGLDDLVPFYAGSGISAGTYTSPTSATVTLLIESSDGPGFTLSGADSATCYNISTNAVPSGSAGWAKWRGPHLYAIAWDC